MRFSFSTSTIMWKVRHTNLSLNETWESNTLLDFTGLALLDKIIDLHFKIEAKGGEKQQVPPPPS